MVIEIGGKTFKTKKEIKEFIRNFMNQIMQYGIIDESYYFKIKKDHKLYAFLESLACVNEDKKALIEEKKLRYFFVQRNEFNKASFYTGMRFEDDSIDNISFLWCVDLIGKKNVDNTKSDLNTCLRKSINDQIEEFKKEQNDKSCEICKITAKYHVDHIIKFRNLAKDYLQTTITKDKEIPKMINDLKHGGKKFDNEKNIFVEGWKKYHKDNAKLRILCEDCNLKQENK